MTLTQQQAVDIIYATFSAAWTNKIAFYEEDPPVSDNPATPFASIHVRHLSSNQATINGATSSATYQSDGVVIVEIYVDNNNGLTEAYNNAKLVLDAYRRASTDVWFKNVTVNEPDRDKENVATFYKISVVAEFTYFESI